MPPASDSPRDSESPAPVQSPQLHFEPDDSVPQTPQKKPASAISPPDTPVPDVKLFSPLRQHKRTPSAHRQVKETLNARVEFTNDESDGRTQHRVNQYLILEEIGRGSYGAVHLGTDQYGNEYAIKEFSKARLRRRAQSHLLRQGPRHPPQPISGRLQETSQRGYSWGIKANESQDALHLIRQEIAIMKKLNHPNLVQLIEVLDDPEEDSLYMVMEMCKKGVVMKVGLVKQSTPYSEEQCRFWFRDLILGIEYLHAQGVIHRDIKPDNLLLSEDDVLKVVDFGVSEMFESTDTMRTTKSAGSPAFLPPELCGRHGEVSGEAADIWSMGVSLFCLRFGRIPFNREGVLAIYDAIKSDKPRFPESESPDFTDLMSRILEKDPEKRIKMEQIRNHPWVTKGGEDPLLSAEENCAHLVEPPNELEVARAFTRKMNHLLCVMKAMHRFRTTLHKVRARTRTGQDVAAIDHSSYTPDAQGRAEDIETIIAQRRLIQEEVSKEEDPDTEAEEAKKSTHDLSSHETLLLGIGTGSTNEFDPTDEETPSAVADSPTAVEYNIYDAAYEEAIRDRMRHSAASHRPTMYLTRFVKEKAHLTEMINRIHESDVPEHLRNMKDNRHVKDVTDTIEGLQLPDRLKQLAMDTTTHLNSHSGIDEADSQQQQEQQKQGDGEEGTISKLASKLKSATSTGKR